MKCYLTEEPAAVERALRRRLAGSARKQERWERYPNGERHLRILRPGRKVCIAGRVEADGSGLFELCLLTDTARRAGAKHVTACLPYLAYARQDKPRDRYDALPPEVIMRTLASAGASRIVAADVHSPAMAAASPVHFTSVSVASALAQALRRHVPDEPFSVVAPDAGARERAETIAEHLGRGTVAWIDKRRIGPRSVRMHGVRGRLEGKTAILVDDMLDTGTTITAAVEELKEEGMTRFYLAVTHALFTGKAVQRLQKLRFQRIVVSDTVPLPRAAERLKGLKVVPAAPLLAEAVKGMA